MHQINRLKIYFISVILTAVFVSCAVPRKPEGGPKDYTPPKMVSSDPAPDAVNFNKNKVILSFDEFIQLKDVQQSFIISPPSQKRIMPFLRNNGKQIVIDFPDTLKPNTTYTLNFGNSVVDLHENNPIPNFTFAFSTGNYIDTLSLTGKIVDAFTHMPNKDGILVMLYPLTDDSIPRKTVPAYVAKSNDKGWFTISHIPSGKFMVFGLKDANSNYKFDQPAELIAFSDTMVNIDQSYYQPLDSLAKHLVYSDSIKFDSIDFYAGRKPQIELYLFEEEYKKQKYDDFSRKLPNQFSLYFELPVNDSLKIELLNEDSTDRQWYVKDDILANDTVSFWITDSILIKKDTLHIKLSYPALDSINQPYIAIDTVKLLFKQPSGKSKKNSLANEMQRFDISCLSSKKQEVDLNDHYYFETSVPVKNIDESKISLFYKEDTVYTPVKFKISKDSVYLRKYNVSFPLEPNREYKLIFDTLALTNIYDINNDSTGFKFKTRNDDYYGEIKLNLTNTSGPMIVQLLSEKDQVIKQSYVSTDGLITFDYLTPAKYKFKAIYDSNGNKKWDTGNWKLRIQPEKVEFLNNLKPVRPNWKDEYIWKLTGK